MHTKNLVLFKDGFVYHRNPKIEKEHAIRKFVGHKRFKQAKNEIDPDEIELVDLKVETSTIIFLYINIDT